MLGLPDPRAALISALVIGCAAFAGGWSVNGWRLSSEYSAERLVAVQNARDALTRLTAERDALAAKLAASDDTHLAHLRTAQNETNRLRDCLRSGACGLRIAAVCPPAGSPAVAAGPGVDTGAGARLDGAAESAYFALRDGIDRAQAQLAACQGELRLRAPASPAGSKSP